MHTASNASINSQGSDKPLITAAEVAAKLCRSRSGLDKLRARHSNFPKPFKMGTDRQSRVYFSRDEIESWISAQLDRREVAA